MRTLAIDFGTRRIGLALSDAGGTWATPHQVLTVTDPQQAIDPIRRLIQQEAVERVVVGLPLNMDGTLSAIARDTLAWARQLSAGSEHFPPMLFVDERLTSFDAEQQLTTRKRAGERLTRQGKKQRLDAIAAAGFLQEFLDSKLTALDVGPLL